MDEEEFDPDHVEVSLDIRRATDGGVDVLRQFDGDIKYATYSGPESIGTVTGWIGWNMLDEDVHDVADAISSDAEPLGAAAASIIEAHPDEYLATVLLIDRLHLDERWRGHRLSGRIIDDILALLRLDPESTVVVLKPEPQKPTGGPYGDGSDRDAAMGRLCAAYRESGLEDWGEYGVWWRPFV